MSRGGRWLTGGNRTGADRGQPVRGKATATGPGRALVAVYGVFAVSATARAGYQLATRFDQAPIPYVLSAVAAVLYIVATLALAVDRWHRVAWVAVLIELVGVLAVGAASVMRPQWFDDPTVWSHFGSGYGFIPVLLPCLGVWWLLRGRRPVATR